MVYSFDEFMSEFMLNGYEKNFKVLKSKMFNKIIGITDDLIEPKFIYGKILYATTEDDNSSRGDILNILLYMPNSSIYYPCNKNKRLLIFNQNFKKNTFNYHNLKEPEKSANFCLDFSSFKESTEEMIHEYEIKIALTTKKHVMDYKEFLKVAEILFNGD